MLLNGDTGTLTEEQQNYATEIFEGNQRMISLVNALLDVSRLDLGKLSNEPKPTSLTALIGDLLKELHPLISSKGLRINRDIDGSLPDILADPQLLRMVMQNLLSNAVKYTPDKGAVQVTLHAAKLVQLKQARLSSKTGKTEYVYFSVSDTGYGIPKAQQDKIFSKLFRADNVQVLDVEGTGLGLYIVKQVVEQMGGRVWFESMESVGTTFFVLLPLHPGVPDVDTIATKDVN
jgi:signal transduction histidine kinase